MGTGNAEVDLENWEERAAIKEFDGNMTREQAERSAALELFNRPALLPHLEGLRNTWEAVRLDRARQRREARR